MALTPTFSRSSTSACGLAVRAFPDAEAQELDALLARRRQLLEMLQADQKRFGKVFGRGKRAVKKSLKTHIAFLERELRMPIPISETCAAIVALARARRSAA